MEFHLLLLDRDSEVPTPHGSTTATLSMVIGSKRWRLSEAFGIDTQSDTIPPYICVSYALGEGHIESILGAGTISDRAVPCLEAAIAANEDIQAIWTAEFCMPNNTEKKQEFNRGYVYSHAEKVIIILDESTWEAINTIIRLDSTIVSDIQSAEEESSTSRLLEIINEDLWIQSLWSYQEIVTSPMLAFVGQTKNSISVDDSSLLNHLGSYLQTFGRMNSITSFDIRKNYPFLDALEDALVDRMLAFDGGPSAFALLSGVYRRTLNGEDCFLSLINILSIEEHNLATIPPSTTTEDISILSESFLSLCERKGDFSFVFCSNRRDTRPGLMWRPAPERLRPMTIWSSFGKEQSGFRVDGGVILKDMYRLTRTTSEIEETVMNALWKKLRFPDYKEKPTLEEVGGDVLARLRVMDYTGSSVYSLWAEGFFFPQHELPSNNDDFEVEIWISTTIQWAFGAPGVAIVKSKGDGMLIQPELIPGVFVGDKIASSGMELRIVW
ncbi:hypothetical protein M422DRAFT_781487 [Sphaerobolus stellatus SS14]|uniref:Heterokaryon incompatibility domain-containing protein n=1 Tax=Sphaerobolus stellatus (strain SS14) TaxID=990650 RepID=A0A0C9U630_SPHS4|nr:hypothetical protein M422DRAFT_781487 [Sphaerobolus stellatus SS14]